MAIRIAVKPSMVLMYNIEPHSHKNNPYRKIPKQKAPNGILSVNSKRKLKSAIKWLTACSDEKQVYQKKLKKKVSYKINLITLTFKNNMQDDKTARTLLSKWLEMAKHRFGIVHYVWKAEPQERGAIHFHIATNTYVPYAEIAYTWNRLLFKNGFDQRNCNSTDVIPIVGVNSLEGYLCEYLMNESKHLGRRAIVGKLWGCSHGLSKAGKLYVEVGREFASECHKMWAADSLENRMRREDKIPPAFLNYIHVWLPEQLTGLPKAIFENELRYLKEYEIKRKPELFPL